MYKVKIGAATVNQTPLDWEGNLKNILGVIAEAKAQGVNILCLPELCISGYGCEDAFFSTDVLQRAVASCQKLIHEITVKCPDMVICVGLPLQHRGALYNTIAVIQGERVLGFVAKQHLAGDGVHYEPRWFKPWPSGVVEDYEGVPIGDLTFDVGPVIGFEICEDAWVANRPGADLARSGVDILLNPSASHFGFGKERIRSQFIREGSRAFGVTYVYANLLGNESGRMIYDGQCFIATNGDIVAKSSKFSWDPFELTTAVVDTHVTKTRQVSSASFSPLHRQEPIEGGWVEALAPLTPVEEESYTNPLKDFEGVLRLGLFDYMRKSHTKGFVVSLSGGADSAACAILVERMIQESLAHFGSDRLAEILGMSEVPDDWVKTVLTCVYQKTRNSSEVTLSAARHLAEDLNAKFLVLDVDDIVESYKEKISKALGRELSWETDDVALQNIQARVRAPSAWMIANIENKLLITTSNRSEAAVGYCTMDGDTAGSLAPLGGIDKAFLLGWLRGMIPWHKDLRGLAEVLAQVPTAELRPDQTQRDDTDLMPYPILEAIEHLAITEKRSPEEVWEILRESKGDSDRLKGYVEKFFRLWCQNQWKRERYAPAFHVADHNLDPRSWCRFPILSSGLKEELESLEKA